MLPHRRSEPPAGTAGFDFDAVYREHIGYVWKSLQRLGTRSADLEDLAHDVFTIAYRKRESFDSERPVRPWLFGIAFRVASDNRRRARHSVEVSTETDYADPGQRHDELAGKRRLCQSALAELNIEQRAVLVMHDLDGHTAPEIADAMQIPLNTVYSRLRLARAKFTMVVRRLDMEKA